MSVNVFCAPMRNALCGVGMTVVALSSCYAARQDRVLTGNPENIQYVCIIDRSCGMTAEQHEITSRNILRNNPYIINKLIESDFFICELQKIFDQPKWENRLDHFPQNDEKFRFLYAVSRDLKKLINTVFDDLAKSNPAANAYRKEWFGWRESLHGIVVKICGARSRDARQALADVKASLERDAVRRRELELRWGNRGLQ